MPLPSPMATTYQLRAKVAAYRAALKGGRMTLQGQVIDMAVIEDGAVVVTFRFAPPPTEALVVHEAFAEAMKVGQPITIAFGKRGAP